MGDRKTLLAAAMVILLGPRAMYAQPAPTWLVPLMRNFAAVPERRANFQEEKNLAALTLPLHASGILIFRRPDHLEKITTAPKPERLVIDGDTLSLSQDDGSIRQIALSNHPELQAVVDAMRGSLSGDLPMLRRHFDIGVSGPANDWHMLLTPNAPGANDLVQRVEITGNQTEILEISITQTNGDRQRLTISPIR